MEQGESAPQFIRDFSKEQSPKEYGQTVESIQKKRQEFHQQRKSRTEKENALQSSITERKQTLNETLANLQNLQDRIDQLSTSGFKKLISYFRLRKINDDIALGQKSYQQLESEQESATSEQEKISSQLKTPPELQEARDILSNFYKNQKEKWSTSNYSKEDIKKYFTEEYLSSLSLEDYVLLLKRFPSEMVVHVTRQGVRDHAAMSYYHNTGLGKYSENFINMLKDGKLRSPLGVSLIENEKEKSIIKFLQLDTLEKEEALRRFHLLITENFQGISGSYADRAAIHFATEEVADAFYGSEKSNEIFIVYPSALIASEYYFSGQLNKAKSGTSNDQWVWTNEERGIDLNSGIIFIPKDTPVDVQTGSRYQLNEKHQPIINLEYCSAVQAVINSADFNNFAEQVMDITGPMYQDLDSDNLSLESQEILKRLEPFRQKLEQQFNIKDKRLQNVILKYDNLFRFITNDPISEALSKAGILFLESQNTIPSQNFWENYFAKNPQQRPSKIVYYQGQDPTTALQLWKKEQEIWKTTEDANIYFPENYINQNDPRANAGLDRFRTLAEKIIKDYYTREESATA